jgi:hypothetical protein
MPPTITQAARRAVDALASQGHRRWLQRVKASTTPRRPRLAGRSTIDGLPVAGGHGILRPSRVRTATASVPPGRNSNANADHVLIIGVGECNAGCVADLITLAGSSVATRRISASALDACCVSSALGPP